MSVNSVNITGNLTRGPELRTTSGGTSVLNIGVAVNDRRRNQQTGNWEDCPNYVDCTIFGKRAESLADILQKGMKVAISGKLHWSSWTAKDGSKRSRLDVIANDVDIMQRAQSRPQQQYKPQPQQMPVQQPEEPYQEDIPF